MHCRSDQFPDGTDFQNEQLILRLDKDIPSDPKLLDDAVKEITAALDRTACWEDIETSRLAVHAALANAVIHGNQSDLKKVVRISVTANENCDLLVSVPGILARASIRASWRTQLLRRICWPHAGGAFSSCGDSWTTSISSLTMARRLECAEVKNGSNGDWRFRILLGDLWPSMRCYVYWCRVSGFDKRIVNVPVAGQR
jgi:hypothetical protein